MLLGLTNLTFSQNEIAFNSSSQNSHLENLKANKRTPEASLISKRITSFQIVAANYNIISKPIYTPNNPTTYTVVFKEAKNVITNVYSHDGDVISSNQKFEAIRLPAHISANILEHYPGWAINAVDCTIKYKKEKQTEVTYKVKINNGTKSKTVKFTELNDINL